MSGERAALIKAHIPSLSNDNEAELEAAVADYVDIDVGDLALRTCACGKRVDGFYEYTDHLIAELEKAGFA